MDIPPPSLTSPPSPASGGMSETPPPPSTPAGTSGDQVDRERDTVKFLQDIGTKLTIPQTSVATAIVYFHRCVNRRPELLRDRFDVALACLFVATKAEETPKKLNDLLDASAATLQFQLAHSEEHKKDRGEWRRKMFKLEKEMLQVLRFDLVVEHPYKPLLTYLKQLPEVTARHPKMAWNFINDSLGTTLCLTHTPELVACAAICLAAEYTSPPTEVPQRNGEPFWVVHGHSEAEVAVVCLAIKSLYGADGPLGLPRRAPGGSGGQGTKRLRSEEDESGGGKMSAGAGEDECATTDAAAREDERPCAKDGGADDKPAHAPMDYSWG